MKYLSIILFSIILFGGVQSCSTDVDINAPWKDITVVYGLLNQNDNIHYIKVNKAFLGDASAYEMAAISDSVNYQDIIEAARQARKSGFDTIRFRIDLIDREVSARYGRNGKEPA